MSSKKSRHACIQRARAASEVKTVSLNGLCRAAGVSRQAHYQAGKRQERTRADQRHVLEAVERERLAQPRLGTRKLKYLLGQNAVQIGRDRLFALLREHGLLVTRKKRRVRTTYVDQSLPVYRNLLYQLEPTRPHHVWVSDVTYIQTDEGFVYLSLITDLVSRRIMGWNASSTNDAVACLQALRMAIAQLPKDRWPIHHSDRGSQYCCHDYIKALRERYLPVSMTEQNHCYENCYAERVNGILKDEYHLDGIFRTRAQAQRAIEQAINTYNTRRPHESLEMLTPHQAHTKLAA